MHDLASDAVQFIDLNTMSILFLFIVGFIGGLVSGFIGSGGAFVLTPAMMSLGVVGPVAVPATCATSSPRPWWAPTNALNTGRWTSNWAW
jgi:ABC-type antimicrobial peptide transport system permease subunit